MLSQGLHQAQTLVFMPFFLIADQPDCFCALHWGHAECSMREIQA